MQKKSKNFKVISDADTLLNAVSRELGYFKNLGPFKKAVIPFTSVTNFMFLIWNKSLLKLFTKKIVFPAENEA